MVSAALVTGFMIIGLTIDSYNYDFRQEKISIPVKKKLSELQLDTIQESNISRLKLSGNLEAEMHWTASFIFPIYANNVIEISVPYMVFIFFTNFLLFKILSSVRNSRSFVQKNTKRLYILGGIFITWALFAIIRTMWMQKIVSDAGTKFTLDLQPQTQYLQLGVVVLLIGYFYKIGVQLEDEKELTV
jgi:hypothetical protein